MSGKTAGLDRRGGPRWRILALVTTGDYLVAMKVIGVKALKARLSEYLRAVRRGETILVADRDEVIAELRPASRLRGPQGELEERLDRLVESGELSRAAQPKEGWTWRAAGLGLPEGTALGVLDKLREEP